MSEGRVREVASCMFDAMFLKCTTYGAGHCYNIVLLMSVHTVLDPGKKSITNEARTQRGWRLENSEKRRHLMA